MSHITALATEISHLPSCAAAVKELGGELHLNVKQFFSYQGMQPCEHVIRVPGVKYEIGVVAGKDGLFTLKADFYGYEGGSHDGHKLQERFGVQCQKLKQYYAIHRATAEAKKRGHFTKRVAQPNGAMRLVVTGVR